MTIVIPQVVTLLPTKWSGVMNGSSYHFMSPVSAHFYMLEHYRLSSGNTYPVADYAVLRAQITVGAQNSAIIRLSAWESGPANPLQL